MPSVALSKLYILHIAGGFGMWINISGQYQSNELFWDRIDDKQKQSYCSTCAEIMKQQ